MKKPIEKPSGKNSKSDRLPSGTLELLTLQVLSQGRQHGYEIARRIHLRSSEALRVEEGSLYPALHRLERQGHLSGSWGVSDSGRRVRQYGLTSSGRKELKSRLSRWTALQDAVGSVLSFDGEGG